MNCRSILTRVSCACLGVLVLLVFGKPFAVLSHRAPNAQGGSGQSSTQDKTKGPSENENNAVSSFAEAESLRAEQREESNRSAVEKYKDAADVWQAAGQFERAAGALRNA